MNNYFKTKLTALLLIVVSFAQAQDQNNQESSWHFKVEPNMLLPHMKGNATVSSLPTVEVDQNAGDFFKHLKFAGMLSAEAENKDWVITADLLYASLGANVEKQPIVRSGKLSAEELMIEAGLLRKIYPWLEAGVSLNLVHLEAEADITAINPMAGSLFNLKKGISKTWVDPMLVARTRNKPNEKFLYTVTGKIGGFGVGSDLTWELEGLAGYQFTKHFYAMAGYQYMSIDYKNGSGNSALKYDMDTFGPMLKLGINLN